MQQNIWSELLLSQVKFLSEKLGGPKLYSQEKGPHFRLISRHAPYAGVDEAGAALWLKHMVRHRSLALRLRFDPSAWPGPLVGRVRCRQPRRFLNNRRMRWPPCRQWTTEAGSG